jgi:quercetin dioxygenase-like cupin family protein
MDSSSFEQKLRDDGFVEIETKSYELRPANGDHGHHFSARGMILDGIFTITVDGTPRSYRAGETFELTAGIIHNEAIGPDGARVMAGRKY